LKPEDRNSAELDRLMTDTEKRLLSSFLDSFTLNLKNSSRLKGKMLRLVVEDSQVEMQIPCSIFSMEIGMLESIVKYLHEDCGLGFNGISAILKRSQNNIAVSYRNSKAKMPARFGKMPPSLNIPLDIFSKKHTCFESICLYLKDSCNLPYHDIGNLLGRDERTIWTIYRRAKQKVKNG
jgi:hypothetical protein